MKKEKRPVYLNTFVPYISFLEIVKLLHSIYASLGIYLYQVSFILSSHLLSFSLSACIVCDELSLSVFLYIVFFFKKGVEQVFYTSFSFFIFYIFLKMCVFFSGFLVFLYKCVCVYIFRERVHIL